MNRKITQNKIVNEEQFKKVHPVNKQMLREFLSIGMLYVI